MPQLDKVTFLSQFFWLAFFYLGFYFLILKFFLPKMSRLLKLRKRKLNLSQTGFHSLLQEHEKVRHNFDTLLIKGFQLSRQFFSQNFQQSSNWIDLSQKQSNQTHYQKVNKVYLQSVGESSLGDNFALTQAEYTIPEKLYTQLLLSKIQ